VLSGRRSNANIRETLFRIAVLLKGLDGALEAAGGIALLAAPPLWVLHIASALTWHFLVAHPHRAVAQHLYISAQHLSTGSERFAAAYLIAHGIVKIGLVAALLQDQRSAYPTAMVVFAVFVIYQLHRYTVTHATLLVALSLFDVIVIGLIWLEYRRTGRAGGVGTRS
jgi:uncharacterized membrane protein